MRAADEEDLPATLRRAVEDGRAAWPDVDVPADAFEAYLRSRSKGGEVAELNMADLYLACGCDRGDTRAIALFDQVHLVPLAAILRSAGYSADFAAEIAQIVRVRLLSADRKHPQGLLAYGGRGSLAGWVRIVALRTAVDVSRMEGRARIRAESVSVIAPPSPEEAAIRARYADSFDQAFRDAFRALDAGDRLILRLHFSEQLPLEGLAQVLGFSRATAGRRVLGARNRLRDETLRLLGERLHASPTEVESVLAALRSQLELSLGALVSVA